MQSHPVPQPISSYEFRLIGSMTIKQFGKLAAASLVGLFFYALQPIPSFIRLGLLAIFVLLGLGLAFLPINERPLDTWIISFIKSAFAPTQFIWQKKPSISPPVKESSSPQNQPPITQKLVSLSPMTTATKDDLTFQTDFDLQEKQLLENFYTAFSSPSLRPKIKLEPVIEVRSEPIAAKAMADGLPYAPSQPNIIYGVIKDKEGKLITGAILEIKDQHGYVVRALRSNKLGQFRTATPLDNGPYEISIEKDGFNFDIIKIDLNGGIAPPVEISTKA